MKILIIGAGVLGSRYAFTLKNVGHDVTIMARGKRLQDIREQGIILQSLNTEKREQAHFQTIEHLQSNSTYDLALVIIRGNQIPDLIPALQKNLNIPIIIFLGNRIERTGELIQAVGPERTLTGFAGAAGLREGHVVKFLDTEKAIQGITYVGAYNKQAAQLLTHIETVLQNSVFPVKIVKNMEAWHKHHLALVIPLALGIYAADGDNYKLAQMDEVLRKIVRAIKECFRAFRKLGYPLTPRKFWLYTLMPEKLLVKLLKKLMSTQGAEIGLAGHANAAKDEMVFFAEKIMESIRAVKITAPAYESLYLFKPEP